MWNWTYLDWSANCVIIYTDVANQVPTFTITETNVYVPVVTLWNQDNAKLLPQLKNGLKRTISWNKHRIISTKCKIKSFDWATFSGCK